MRLLKYGITFSKAKLAEMCRKLENKRKIYFSCLTRQYGGKVMCVVAALLQMKTNNVGVGAGEYNNV